MEVGVALTHEFDDELTAYLQREDGQEDVCFALYSPSTGAERFTGIVNAAIWPDLGDRDVHGNASFLREILGDGLDSLPCAHGDEKMNGVLSEGMMFDIGYADGFVPVLAVPEAPVATGLAGSAAQPPEYLVALQRRTSTGPAAFRTS